MNNLMGGALIYTLMGISTLANGSKIYRKARAYIITEITGVNSMVSGRMVKCTEKVF